ncbi:hypothetical protein HDV03_005146 [Kappamyces sp. JEL0829]|nr:hypothetical protein HDV03_005146 [Kappamyces sp. JEL0829]
MNDSTLKSLSVSSKAATKPIVLSPPFDKTVLSYRCVVESRVDAVSIKSAPSQTDGFAQVQKTNKDDLISLGFGSNPVEIRVEAPDGSHSTVRLEVFRPSEGEIGLAALVLPSGSFQPSPSFSRYETSYVVEVAAELDVFPVVIDPLNRNCKVEASSNLAEGLHLGDSVVEYALTSESGKETAVYRVTARKPFRGSLPVFAARPDRDLLCSLCQTVQTQPRTNAFGCSHIFCYACLDSLVEATVEAAGTIWKCPLDGKSCTTNPTLHSHQENEKKLAALLCDCPFAGSGCEAKGLQWRQLAKHIAECDFASRTTCPECGLQKSAKEVHPAPCSFSCPKCFKKVAQRDGEIHLLVCGTEAPVPRSIDAMPDWERQLVSSKQPFSMDKTTAALQEAHHELCQAYRDSVAKLGRGSILPNLTTLDSIKGALAHAISLDIDSAKLKKIPGTLALHLALAKLLHSVRLTHYYFPEKKTQTKPVASDNDAAKDSFMADEVSGLLLQLGLPPTTNDTLALKAMEEEYHNMKNSGKVDQAAEIQGLISWKMGKMGGSSQSQDTSTSTLTNSPSAMMIAKLKDCVQIDPLHQEASEMLQVCCIEAGDYAAALTEAKRLYSHLPTNSSASRLVFAVASAALDTDHSAPHISIVEEYMQAVRHRSWTASESPINSIYHYGSPFFNSVVKVVLATYQSMAAFDKAVRVIEDCLYQYPKLLMHAQKPSTHHTELSIMWMHFQSELLKLSAVFPNPLASLVVESAPYSCERIVARSGQTEQLLMAQLDLLQVLTKIPSNHSSAWLYAAMGNVLLTCFDSIPRCRSDPSWLARTETMFKASIGIETNDTTTVAAVTKQEWSVALDASIKKLDDARKRLVAAAPKKPAKEAAKTTVPAAKPASGAKSDNVKPKAAPAKAASSKAAPSKAPPPTAKPIPTPVKSAPATVKPGSTSTKKTPAETKTASPEKPGLQPKSGGKLVQTKTPTTETKVVEETPTSTAKPEAISEPRKGEQRFMQRYGLAQTYMKMLALQKEKGNDSSGAQIQTKAALVGLLLEVVGLQPGFHDAYIDLATIYLEDGSIAQAIDIYVRFPFAATPTTDDIFVHQEINRLIMKEKQYKHPSLQSSLIAEGQLYGIKSISKYTDALDAAGETNLLKAVFAGANRKSVDDPDMVAFFKAKYWM